MVNFSPPSRGISQFEFSRKNTVSQFEVLIQMHILIMTLTQSISCIDLAHTDTYTICIMH